MDSESSGGRAGGAIPPLSVTLTRGREVYTVGENVVVRVEVRNLTGGRLLMVGVLDGSESGERYPLYAPRINGPSYRAPALERPGYTSPLRPRDFHFLDAGEGFDPTATAGGAAYLPLVTFTEFRPQTPGLYELSLTLATDSEHDTQWLGSLTYPQDEVLTLIAQVPHTRVESNILVVEVCGL